MLAQLGIDLLSLAAELFGQGQHGGLVGRQSGMQPQHGADVVLGRVHHFLVISVAQEGQHHAVRAQRGLDDIGNIAGVVLLVKVGHILARGGLVGSQVKVGAGGHAPQLAPVGEGEGELKVGGGVGVVAQLGGIVVPEPQAFLLDAQIQQPFVAEVFPIGEPLQFGAGLAEELQLHLLKLPGAEGEVAGGDLIAEGFADLTDAEGQLPPGGALDVLEVDENALGGLGPQIDGILRVLGDALESLEHQVEFADVREIVLAAAGAGDAVVIDEGFHLILAHGVHGLGQGDAVLQRPFLNDLVRTEALLALLAVHQGIGEAAHMAGGHPNLGVHQNGRVQTHVVGILLDEFFPPGPFDIVFQLHAQRTVVPGVGQAAVDLAAGKDKAPALAQGNDLIHRFICRIHRKTS